MLETPVTSNGDVVGFLSNLPAYRTGVSPLLRGVEIGLAHGYWLTGADRKKGGCRVDADAPAPRGWDLKPGPGHV